MSSSIEIAGRKIGKGHPVFIVAEMSANHEQNYSEAVKIIQAAKQCGADAIKLQTYTPDTMTLDCDNEYFKIKETIWKGETLYNLYGKARTPWEWQPRLKEIADEIGIILFSTPFDATAIDFLEDMDIPAYKVSSFELVDIPLIEYIASKGKPMIISTGMGSVDEITDAVEAARGAGIKDIALLKCTSSYPAAPDDMNLLTIPDIAERFGVVAGLSDHTLSIEAPIASIALGARIIEKHLTLSRNGGGPDVAFSLEPDEFKAMVEAVRIAERSLGTIYYGSTLHEEKSMVFRRSLFIVKDMAAGDVFTEENVRSIRPGYGMAPKHMESIIGKNAKKQIKRGTPLSWELIKQ